ncbi:MAG: hypothetical protein ABIK09_17100 [Pseudomonadota bacterium]
MDRHRFSTWPVAGLLFVLFAACGDGGGDGSSLGDALDEDHATSDQETGAEVPRTGDVSADAAGPYDPEGYIIAFGYRGMVPGLNDEEHDLKLIDRAGRDPLTGAFNAPHGLTTFHLDTGECELVLSKTPDGAPLETAPCSCAFGCVVDDDLDWLAISTEKPGPNGHVFKVARFNQALEAKVLKGVTFKGVADFHFAGHFLLYTTSQFCTSTGCQYALNRYDLDNIAKTPEVTALIPPEGDQDWVDGAAIYKGHFQPSADGRKALFLSPTIRSQRVYLWTNGDLAEVDYICPGGLQDGHCTGTGSDFKDSDPSALSADGAVLAYLAVVDHRLELRLPAADGGPPEVVALQAVEEGKGYTSNICTVVFDSEWKFSRVTQMEFSDPDTLLFVGHSDCKATAAKAWTDLWSLSLAGVTGKDVVGQGDLDRLIHNPRHDGIENTVIDGFAVGIDGETIAFNASPRYGGDLVTELSPQSPNATKSREIWLLEADGTRRQLTFDAEFSATRPLVLPLTALKDAKGG